MPRGLLVGRFQPFHRGHLGVLEALRASRPRESLLLGIGSAQESYTVENPFTASERWEMIDRALSEAHLSNWQAVPLADIHQHALWVSHLAGLLPPFERVYTNNPLTRLLFERAGYAVESPPLIDRDRFEGAKIRALITEGGDWASRVPPAVAAYVREVHGVERLQLLAQAAASRAARP
jgi:nicotinamide-nucleotide adenylyltransferase